MADKAANVAIVAAGGLSLFGLSVAMEVFGIDRSADYGVPWYRLTVCSPGARAVTAEGGLRLAGAEGLRALRSADLIVVPGLDLRAPPPETLLRELARAHRAGARIASLCTGAFVLAAAGLLDGRRATTHWDECVQFAAAYPRVKLDPEVLYVDEGDILTSAGSAASIDLCLHIVRGDYGSEIAARLARDLVMLPFREGGQVQYIETPPPALDSRDPFFEVLTWIQAHLDEMITIEDLAKRAAMSKRNFARRFVSVLGTTPYQWIVHQRLQLAQRLLETTELSIEAVAQASGLASAANLRARFADGFRTTPSAYRRGFRGDRDQAVLAGASSLSGAAAEAAGTAA